MIKNPGDPFFKITPLHVAAINGHLKIIDFIVENIIDANPGDEYGTTPLHLAAGRGHLEACRFFLSKIVDRNPKNIHGQAPFNFAAIKKCWSVCWLIVNYLGYDNLSEEDQMTMDYIWSK